MGWKSKLKHKMQVSKYFPLFQIDIIYNCCIQAFLSIAAVMIGIITFVVLISIYNFISI
ncbi:MAG: hypothetical protein ACTSYB_09545 [Candidatus Helarchaeota archaeon]